MPFFFTWVNDELFEFNKMVLVYGYTVLIGSLWLIKMILEKNWRIKRTFLDVPIGLFLISQIASTIFSIHPYTSVFGYYSRFHGGLVSTFSYILLFYAFVNNVSKKQLKYFLLSVFISAIGVTLYAIPEHFGHSPSCLLISGDFGVDCWVQKVQDRIFGTFGQPNWLAAYVIMLIPVSLALSIKNSFFQRENGLLKHNNWLFASATLLLTTTLLFTKSRSGVLGFGVSMIIFYLGLGWLWLKSSGKLKSTISTLSGLTLPILMLIILAIFGSPYSPSIKEIMNKQAVSENQPEVVSPNENFVVNRLDIGGTDSGQIRKIVWEGAYKVWRRYPIFGSGVETFAYSYYKDRPMEHNNVSEWDFLYNKAHNEFLNFLATTGAVGLVAYVLLLSWFGVKNVLYIGVKNVLYIGSKIKNGQDFGNKVLALGLFSGVVALTISNFFGFSTVTVSMLMFIYFAILAVLMSDSPDSKQDKKELSPGTTEYIAITIVSLMSIFLLSRVQNMWRADSSYAKATNLSNQGQFDASLTLIQKAIKLRPREALYYDRFATTLGQVTIFLAQQEQLEQATDMAKAAISLSDKTNKLNGVHLNFYKSRAALFTNLSLLDPNQILEAQKAYEEALERSPTDPKIVYRLGLINEAMGNNEAAVEKFKLALDMKPDYVAVRVHLGDFYAQEGQLELALYQYQEIAKLQPENGENLAKIASISAQMTK